MDILTKLVADHRWFYENIAHVDSKVFDYVNKFSAKDWTQEVSRTVSETLTEILKRTEQHEAAEAHVLFPELRRHQAVPQAVLDRMVKDHESIHRGLHQFIDAVSVDQKPLERERLLRLLRLVSLIQRHMVLEEIEVFDIARTAMPYEMLEELGERIAWGGRESYEKASVG